MTASKSVRTSTAVADPDNPTHAIKPNADGSLNVVVIKFGPASGATPVDKSFVTDGTEHVVIAANASRIGFLIENPVSTSLNLNGDSIFVNLGAAATSSGNSFEVTPGGYFPPPWLPLYLGDIHVIGATGIKCPAKEFTS
jgi:hypothetical protein